MPRTTRIKSLVIACGLLVAICIIAALIISTKRDRRTTLEIRKQSTAIMLDLTGEMDRAAVAMQAFNSDGGLDLSGLEDQRAIDRRIDLAAKAQAAAAKVFASGESAPDRLAESLRGRPADRIEAAKLELPQKMNWATGRHIFQTHVRAYSAAKAHLEFLKQHEGHWRVDPVGLRVNWDSQQFQGEAEKLQAEVTAAAEEQAALASQQSPASAQTRPAAPQTRSAAQGR
jgi:hypothetical protein